MCVPCLVRSDTRSTPPLLRSRGSGDPNVPGTIAFDLVSEEVDGIPRDLDDKYDSRWAQPQVLAVFNVPQALAGSGHLVACTRYTS